MNIIITKDLVPAEKHVDFDLELARDMAQHGITIGNALHLGSGDTGSNQSKPERGEQVTARVVEEEPRADEPTPPSDHPAQPEQRTTENPFEPVPQYRVDDPSLSTVEELP